MFESEIISIYDYFTQRLTVSERGDDPTSFRFQLFYNALGYLDISSSIFGLDGGCIVHDSACKSKDYLPFGENPLSMLVYYGILLSFPYYFVIFHLLHKAIERKDFIVFGVFLLLLQRPFVMSFGYSVIVMLYIWSIFIFKKKKINAALLN